MKLAGGIIAIISGVIGFFAGIITLFIGGFASAVEADGANTVIGLGWGGILFSILVIIFGSIAIKAKTKVIGIILLVCTVGGMVLGGTLVAIILGIGLIGGILATIGAIKQSSKA